MCKIFYYVCDVYAASIRSPENDIIDNMTIYPTVPTENGEEKHLDSDFQ